jgi:hypothetical protein
MIFVAEAIHPNGSERLIPAADTIVVSLFPPLIQYQQVYSCYLMTDFP